MNNRNIRTERFHYGICLNDECSKCRNKEVQQVPLRKELVCEECGKPLRKCAPASKKSVTKYIMMGAIIIVLGLAGVFLLNDGEEADVPQQIRSEFVVQVVPVDTMLTEQVILPEKQEIINDDTITTSKESVQADAPKSITYKVEFGTYEGPMSNGKPHGYGGTIQVTHSYSIDLKKMPAEYLQVYEGDIIVSTKFVNGVLRAGELHRKDGTRKVFTI